MVMMIIFLSLQAILEDEVKETKTAQDTLSNFQKVKVMYKFQTNFVFSWIVLSVLNCSPGRPTKAATCWYNLPRKHFAILDTESTRSFSHMTVANFV